MDNPAQDVFEAALASACLFAARPGCGYGPLPDEGIVASLLDQLGFHPGNGLWADGIGVSAGLEDGVHLARIREARNLPPSRRLGVLAAASAIAAMPEHCGDGSAARLAVIAGALGFERSAGNDTISVSPAEVSIVHHGNRQGVHSGPVGRVAGLLATAIDSINPSLPIPPDASLPAEWRDRVAGMQVGEALARLRGIAGTGNQVLRGQGLASYSPDGQEILTANVPAREGNMLSVWDARTFERKLQIPNPYEDPQSLAKCSFSHDGTKVLSLVDEMATVGDGLRVWDARTGELAQHLGEGALYASMETCASAPLVLCASHRWDFVHLWNYETGELVCEIPFEPVEEPFGSFSPDGRAFIVAQFSGSSLAYWDIAARQEIWQAGKGYEQGVFSPDGTLVIALHTEQPALVLHVLSGETARELCYPGIRDARFSADGRYMFTNSRGELDWIAWDAASFTQLHRVERQEASRRVVPSPDGNIAAFLEDHRVVAVDFVAGTVTDAFECDDRVPSSIAFRPDGRQALVVSARRETLPHVSEDVHAVDVWDLRGRPSAAGLALSSPDTAFLVAQALAFLEAPPLEGATIDEMSMRTMMLPPAERRLAPALQAEGLEQPGGQEAVIHGLLGLLERMGEAGGVGLRQQLAAHIAQGLVSCADGLAAAGDQGRANALERALLERIRPVLSALTGAGLEGAHKAGE